MKNRHKCCICGAVRYEENMEIAFSNGKINTWVCSIWSMKDLKRPQYCAKNPEIELAREILAKKKDLKILYKYV